MTICQQTGKCRTNREIFEHNIPRLIQEAIESLTRPATSNEIELVIIRFPTKKSTDLHYFASKFY